MKIIYQILFSFLLILFTCKTSRSQVTHGVSFQVGVTGTYYKSSVRDSKSYSTLFMPIMAFDYSKFNDNIFWGGVGYGLSPRMMPLYKYQDGTKIGIEYPEFWFRVRTGLKIQNEFLSHLPHIGLGIAINSEVSNYTNNGFQNGISYYDLGDSLYNVAKYRPYIELANTMINSTFREAKRNMFITFGIRYYPLPVFTKKVDVTYDYNSFKQVQYNIMEVFISAGIQKNFQR